jgi:hypothetical protein
MDRLTLQQRYKICYVSLILICPFSTHNYEIQYKLIRLSFSASLWRLLTVISAVLQIDLLNVAHLVVLVSVVVNSLRVRN